MERLADVILCQVVIDGLAVLLDLEDILAFLGFVQRAFGAHAYAGEGGFSGRIRREHAGGAERQQNGDGGGEEQFCFIHWLDG